MDEWDMSKDCDGIFVNNVVGARKIRWPQKAIKCNYAPYRK